MGSVGNKAIQGLVSQKNMQLKSFIELRIEYGIPNTDFFRYLQMRNLIQSLRRENMLRSDLYEIEEILMLSTTIKGKISELYNIFFKDCQSSFCTFDEDLGN